MIYGIFMNAFLLQTDRNRWYDDSTFSGWSKQSEYQGGQSIAFDLLPRPKFEIVIPDLQLESVI